MRPWLAWLGACCLAAATVAHPALADPLQFSHGGFVKVHALLGDISAGRALRGDQELYIPQLPVTARPAGDARRHHLHARSSRLWLRAQTQESALGSLELFAEGDLFKYPERYSPRLRHGYVRVGRLLLGQTWSSFVNPQALADIDAGTAVGNSVTRLHQLRWQQALQDGLQLYVGLEAPLNRLHFSGEPGIRVLERERPYDLALRLEKLHERGTVSLAAVRRALTVSPAQAQPQDRRSALAFSLAGRLDIGALDNLRFMLNFGDGLARHSVLGSFADAMVQDDGRLAVIGGVDSMLAWQHFWSRSWRSTLALSTGRSAVPAQADGNLTRQARSSHANLIWAPGTRWSLGLEYLHAWRQLQNGADGELQRLQLTLRLNL